MKTTNNINFYNQLVLFLVYLNSATILIPDKFKGWSIGFLLVVVILRYFKIKNTSLLETKKLIISVAFFIILVLSIIYTSDTGFAIKKIETGASLIAFPLIFFLIGSDKSLYTEKTVKTLKLTFIFSLLFFLVLTFLYFFLTEPFYTFKSTLVHYTNLVDIRIEHYEIHAIYLSIYIGISILFSLSIIQTCKPTLQKILYFVVLLLFIFLAILNKKGPIISLGILGIVYLVKSRFNYKQTLYIFSIAIISILLIVYIPKYNNTNRFKELFDIEKNENSSTGIRIQIYKCAIEKIAKAPIFGYGWGDTKTILNNCYAEKNKNLLKKNYNSHNQFLSILLSTGLLGFLAFLYYLFYLFKISNKRESQLFFFLVSFFCLNMLTENILEREDGVIIVTLFINFFLFSSNKEKDISINQTQTA